MLGKITWISKTRWGDFRNFISDRMATVMTIPQGLVVIQLAWSWHGFVVTTWQRFSETRWWTYCSLFEHWLLKPCWLMSMWDCTKQYPGTITIHWEHSYQPTSIKGWRVLTTVHLLGLNIPMGIGQPIWKAIWQLTRVQIQPKEKTKSLRVFHRMVSVQPIFHQHLK